MQARSDPGTSSHQAGTESVRGAPTYEVLAADLKAAGVATAFCLMSDDTALLLATLDAIDVPLFSVRHENNVIAAAEGYAASTDRLGVAVIGRGPASANGLHALISASRTGSKVLVIAGSAPAGPGAPNGSGPDRKQFDAALVFESAGLQTFRPTDPASARSMLAAAISVAERGSLAVLLLPTDVQLAPSHVTAGPKLPRPKAGTPQVPRESAIAAAVGVIESCRRPLIVAGHGAVLSDARSSLERMADKIGALLATTVRAKDFFRGHPANLGLIGSFSHSAARRLIDEIDCVIAFGAGLNQHTTAHGDALPAGVRLIHIDNVRSHIGRWFPADVALVGDARLVADRLLEALPSRQDADAPFRSHAARAQLASFDPRSEIVEASTARTLDPRLLAIELDRLLPAERNVVWDSGNFLQVLPYLGVVEPRRLKMTSDFASVGLGFGTALGFARGSQERTTALIIGDGGLLMTLGELETVAREGLPIVIVVMNDCAYGAEMHYLKLRNMPVSTSLFPDIDFAGVAAALGFETATVRSFADLEAIAPQLATPQGPILIDCKINAAVQAPFYGAPQPARK